MKIITESNIETIREFTLDFIDADNPNSGYSFPCDGFGHLKDDMPDEAKKSYEKCINHPEKYIADGIIEHEYKYRNPAIGQCVCGELVELVGSYMGADQCQKCGRWYNMFGQALIDPEYWDMGDEDY